MLAPVALKERSAQRPQNPQEGQITPGEKSPQSRVGRRFGGRFGRVIRVIHADEDTKISFLPSGKASLDKMEEIVKTGRRVYVQVYTYDGDSVGEHFMNTFEASTKEHPNSSFGLLIDHFGVRSRAQRPKLLDMLTRLNSNGRVHVVVTNYFHALGIFHQFPFNRDHTKSAVNEREALITTANISYEHYKKWLDAGIHFEGGSVPHVIEQIVANTFAHAERWRRVYATTGIRDYTKKYGFIPKGQDLLGAIVRNPLERGKKVVVRMPNGETVEILTDSFFAHYQEATKAAFSMIKNAQKGATVNVFTPYPGLYTLTKQMITAARNGVTINLIIPSNNDYALYNPDNLPAVIRPFAIAQLKIWKKRLKKAGVHLYEFEGMLHIKAVDVTNPDGTGELWLGSANLTRGFIPGRNREMATKLSNRKVRKDFAQFTQQVLKSKQLF